MAKPTFTGDDPLDFTDTSDLPDEIAKDVAQRPSANSAKKAAYIDIVVQGKKRGHMAVAVKDVVAAAHRLGLESASKTQVRGWLNDAIKENKLKKVGRTGYCGV